MLRQLETQWYCKHHTSNSFFLNLNFFFSFVPSKEMQICPNTRPLAWRYSTNHVWPANKHQSPQATARTCVMWPRLSPGGEGRSLCTCTVTVIDSVTRKLPPAKRIHSDVRRCWRHLLPIYVRRQNVTGTDSGGGNIDIVNSKWVQERTHTQKCACLRRLLSVVASVVAGRSPET